jgi:hypothetical protein
VTVWSLSGQHSVSYHGFVYYKGGKSNTHLTPLWLADEPTVLWEDGVELDPLLDSARAAQDELGVLQRRVGLKVLVDCGIEIDAVCELRALPR